MARHDRDARRDILLASPLFQAMQAAELDAMLDMATDRHIARGQLIFQKGDAGSAMMAVLAGRVRISANSPEGREVTLNEIAPGEVFGEIALLDGETRSADAMAAEDTLLMVLERRHFLPFLLDRNELMLRLLVVLCRRLRQTSVALEDLALFGLPERLARLLLKLADDYGRRTPDGVRIDMRLSQKDLSNRVAATRESVNKQLSAWRSRGVLRMDGSYIVLRDRATLAALVG